jgi:uncharacterized membrane protein YkvI
MFKKSPLKATRLHQRKRRILFLKIAGIIFTVLIFIFGLSLVSKNEHVVDPDNKCKRNFS